MMGDRAMVPEKTGLNCMARKLTQLMTAIYDEELAKSNLKTTQYSLLCHVHNYGPVLSTEIAKLMGIEQMKVSRNLRQLLCKGWIAQSDDSDVCQRFLTITPDGSDKKDEAEQYWLIAQKKIRYLTGLELYTVLDLILVTCIEKF